ncbi:MAG: carbohydrate binding family 9 domain-containing protein [Gemmatimonadaceae bacterium]|nr:carbohydrate binding family 9 domain-containing protein [Gemmatimonadaceae bacterium]
MRFPALLLSTALVAHSAIAQQQNPSVTIPRLDAPITVDGVLDEPVWQQAALLDGFRQYLPVDSRPAQERTEVRLWYAPDALMVGIRAFTADVASLRATRADRDKIGNDDRIILYLDTFNDKRRAFMFGVNPLGVQLDGVRTEGGYSATSMMGGSIDYAPDFFYESRGRLTAQGYEVELRIPFKSLRLPGTGAQTWGFNVHRFSPSTGYEDTWTDVRRAGASFLVQGGTLTGLHDLQRGVVTEVQPFVTSTASGARLPDGSFGRSATTSTAGANVRLGFTQLSLDATFNPDFSQVESDAGLVTLNERFALYVPEKRPFFLEGIELFATPNQLVYTRQLTDPSVGGKVTGKMGAYSVALLSAIDHESAGSAQFQIGRVRRDLGEGSTAGITVTDKEQGGNYNRVMAADARIVYGKLYFFEAQLGGASTRTGPLDTQQGHIWKLENDRTGRHWGYNIQWIDIGQGFRSQAGFVPRSDITSFHWFNRLSWYGAKGALLESFTTFASPQRIWRSGAAFSSAPLEGEDKINFMVRLRGGWNVSSSVGRRFFYVDPSAYGTYRVDSGSTALLYQPAQWQTGLADVQASVSTPVLQRVNASVSVQRTALPIFAEGSRGTDVRISATVSLRPTAAARVDGTLASSRITRRLDGSEFARTLIPRLKLEYQLTRAMFVRVVGEYRSERRDALRSADDGRTLWVNLAPSAPTASSRLRVDWLASYQPVPGTVAFLGYGSGLDAPRADEFSALRRADDALFVKLAYQFRR